MDLVSLKYWHWMVLGVLIGGLIGYAWTGFDPQMPRSGNVQQFKAWVGQTSDTEINKGRPRIFDITVLAPETDPNGKTVNAVTFKMLGTDSKREKPLYQEQSIYADVHFDGNDNVAQFLAKKGVSFSDRTGPGKYLPVGYGVAAGLLGVGLIWPTMIRLLVGAGFAAPKPVVEEERHYATGDQNDGTVKPKKRLFGFGGGGEPTPDPLAAKPVVDAAGDVDTSKLFTSTGGAAQETQARAPDPEEQKEYGGDYYPVARPAHKGEHKPE